ncbi:MAG: SDR family oxidoreductase [Anaerolineae bacterium]|nr:SDR family oxidoreductase [Anaerolineae bacterium]
MRTLKNLMNLEGRTALITGGAGHIGVVMAGALAELGAAVAVLDVDAAKCEQTAAQISREWGVETLPLAVDLFDEAAVKAAPGQVADSLGGLDILINNAAFVGTSKLEGWAVPFRDQSVDTWRRALEVNLTAAFALTQAAADFLGESGHGAVINIGSIYGMVAPDFSLYEGTAMGNPAAYGASKGGLMQLTRYLAAALAPKVRVNAISPGGVWRNQPEAFHERYKTRTPLGRMAVEEDFKGAVAYLASDLSAYVTGHNLVVDGGWSIW